MGVSKIRDTVVSQHFAVPFGLVDARQANAEEGEYYYDEADIAEEGPVLLTAQSTIPMPPSSYEITEQVVRIAADGRSVVDVYIDFPDVEGIERIEVGITPA